MLLAKCICFSQAGKADSILKLINQDKEDTTKSKHLNDLAWKLMYTNPDTSIILSNQAFAISEKNNWPKGCGRSNINLGTFYWLKSDYIKALSFYEEALIIYEALLDKKNIAVTFGNIGLIYDDQANYTRALEYYLKALIMAEDIGDKNGIARHLNNIGVVYEEQSDYPKALNYYLRALKANEEIGDKDGISGTLGNIGVIYKKQKDYHKALDYYLKSVKIMEEIENKNGMSIEFGNLGILYDDLHNYDEALKYYMKALKITEELGDKNGTARHLSNIGGNYTATGKYKEAESYLFRALYLHREIGAINDERQDEDLLSGLYEKTGRHDLALEHYKKAMALKDTIFTNEKNKELTRKEMNYEFEKKTAALKADQDKKDAVTRIVIYSVSTGLFLMLLLAVFIYRGYRQKQRANIVISEQKLLVEEKQKEILDSIHYARRIQRSLLPTLKYIDKSLKILNKN